MSKSKTSSRFAKFTIRCSLDGVSVGFSYDVMSRVGFKTVKKELIGEAETCNSDGVHRITKDDLRNATLSNIANNGKPVFCVVAGKFWETAGSRVQHLKPLRFIDWMSERNPTIAI